jgi:hypothetical protein
MFFFEKKNQKTFVHKHAEGPGVAPEAFALIRP